jgi:hypothetical protein
VSAFGVVSAFADDLLLPRGGGARGGAEGATPAGVGTCGVGVVSAFGVEEAA